MEITSAIKSREAPISRHYTLRRLLIDIVFLLFLFQIPIQNSIHIVSYLDEILAVLFLVVLLFNFRFLMHREKTVLSFCLVLVLLTLVGSLVNNYQPFSIAISDLFLYIKLWACIFGGFCFFRKRTNTNKYLPSFSLVKFIIVVLFVLTLVDQIFHIFPTNESSSLLFLRSVQLFFGHETFFVAYTVLVMSVYILTCYVKRIRIRKAFLIMLFIMIAMSLKAKAFIFIALLALFFFYIYHKKYRFIQRLFPWVMALLFIGIIFFLTQFYTYAFKYSTSARILVPKASFEIALDYFPFGVGFGAFGSHFSGVNYSPVYAMYNLDNIYGITASNHPFISDNFYPMILGQGGVFALLLYLIMIVLMLKMIAKRKNIVAAILFLYLIAASVGESSFCQTYAPVFGIFMAMSFCAQEERIQKYQCRNSETAQLAEQK